MKRILLIATGGTIASKQTQDGLAPSMDVNSLLSYIPDIKTVCKLDGISVMNVDSTNMTPALMKSIAKTVADNYGYYDGFVVAHGTDTMAYSAAAVTYMLKNLSKPVVFTGSQIPIEAMYTDAKKNLSDAIRFACEKIRGVYVVFDGIVINGTHAMKVKTRNADAFKSINHPVIAHIKHGRITYNEVLEPLKYKDELNNDIDNSLILDTDMCKDIMLLKMFPGIGTGIFDYIKDNYKGVIIESFGIGGIPNEGNNNNIAGKIYELIQAGVAVVITTQCIYEGIDLNVYEVGQTMAKLNVIMSGDMTTEALTMKLMWALAHYDNIDDIKKYIENAYFADRSY